MIHELAERMTSAPSIFWSNLGNIRTKKNIYRKIQLHKFVEKVNILSITHVILLF